MEISEISGFEGVCAFVDLVDEVDCLLDVFLDGILGDEHGVLDLLVVKKGLLEDDVPLTPLLLHAQPHILHPKITLREELHHAVVAVDEAEDLGDPAHLCQRQEHIFRDIAADVDDQRWVQLLYGPSRLLHVLIVQLLLV